MTDKPRILIRKVAVLGAGVMGAQIAAHFTNADIDVILFDLPAKEGDVDAIVKNALTHLQKLEPSPLANKAKVNYIQPANYKDHLPLLEECDLVIEAVAERMDIKKDLFSKIAQYINPNAVFATNTSGLSIGTLAEVLPQNLRKQFCGMHFFNPPRYMALVELVPNKETSSGVLDHMEEFLTSILGKSVIRAKDTPNFIANRIGVFATLITNYHAEKFNLGFDVVDALTGPILGRPKSATFRTMDVVGLDTFGHVIKTMAETLPNDPWKSLFVSPAWLTKLLEKGALGQKVGAGVYKKVGKEIHVLNLATQNYEVSHPEVDAAVMASLKLKNPQEKIRQLRENPHPQAQFIWSIFRDIFHYAAYHLEEIADNARDLDFAIRWGFGWSEGPFETWQAANWQSMASFIAQDIQSNKAFISAPLPAWVMEPSRTGVHFELGSYSPSSKNNRERRRLPVYQRQYFPEKLFGEGANIYGETVWENEGVRFWTIKEEPEIGILSFKSKMNTMGSEVLEGVLHAVKLAENSYKGLVFWQPKAPFSAGANLAQVVEGIAAKDFVKLEAIVARFQQASMAVKHSLVPTVSAVQGLALGGGCELVMHSAKVVAALETYMGLVEVGVGLLPAGGGTKEFTRRAAQEAKGGNIFPFLARYFENIAMAKVSKSAHEAKELGYLRQSDTIVFNANELLYVALKEARNLYESNYRPPLKQKDIVVTGKGGIATLKANLTNMLVGGFISEHDYAIGTHIATIMGGGEIEQNALVSEDWLLTLERKCFVELLKTEKTQQRIEFMLKNGKPLRN